MSDELSRRDFLRATAMSLSVCAAGGLMTGCASSSAPQSDSDSGAAPVPVATSNADGTLTVAGGGALKPGAALLFTLPGKEASAFVFKAENGELRALSARCTHAGCAVEWEAAPQQFACPCHKSRFSASGAVLSGPAKKPLPRFAAKAQGNNAIISLKS